MKSNYSIILFGFVAQSMFAMQQQMPQSFVSPTVSPMTNLIVAAENFVTPTRPHRQQEISPLRLPALARRSVAQSRAASRVRALELPSRSESSMQPNSYLFAMHQELINMGLDINMDVIPSGIDQNLQIDMQPLPGLMAVDIEESDCEFPVDFSDSDNESATDYKALLQYIQSTD